MANEKTFEVFCSECGEKFTASSKMAHLCPACKAKRQEEKKAYAKEYAKKRNEMGLVTIQIFKDDRENLKALAAKKNCTVSEIVAEMLKTEEKEEKKPAKKAE